MNNIVEDVPEDIEYCEYYCPLTDCTHENWESCGHRLRYIEYKNNVK